MSDERVTRAAEHYGLDDMLARVPSDRSQILIGFTPWRDDAQGWKRSVAQRVADIADAPAVGRTIWQDPDDSTARVRIDVYECASTASAVRTLIEVLAWNHLASIPEDPEGPGQFAFVHPDNVPPAAMFVRANLCLVVSSYGTTPVPVMPWAQRLDSRILDRPTETEEADILREAGTGDEAAEIAYALPWALGDEGYVKIFAEGGVVELHDETVTVRGYGEIEIEAYVVEPDRPTYRSRRRIALA